MFKHLETNYKSFLENILINESINEELMWLYKYFKQTDDDKIKSLPYSFPNFFDDFLIEEDIEYPPIYPNVDSDGNDIEDDKLEDYDLICWLGQNDKEMFYKYGKYLFDKINNVELPIDETDYPSWFYLSGSPKLLINKWLIHFSDHTEDISKNGFTKGINDIEKLGLTNYLSTYDKMDGGFNFAYEISTFKKYAKGRYSHKNGYKYGDEAVVFIASGVQVWHSGDEEPQVIFDGKTAKHIVRIEMYEDLWSIRDKNNRVLYKNEDLETIVFWLEKNYNQYKKVL